MLLKNSAVGVQFDPRCLIAAAQAGRASNRRSWQLSRRTLVPNQVVIEEVAGSSPWSLIMP